MTLSRDDNFYITGGTLPLDADSYVVRQADTQLLDGLRQGEFCYVLNTRQMGKSSLMIRTARRLRAEGCRVVVLDLTAIGQNLSVEQWYFGLLLRTANQTGHAPELTAFWKSNRELGPMQRFLEALRTVLLTPRAPDEPVAPLVICVDEIDAVLSLAFSADEFFAGIRECYNRRSHDAAFRRLTFCLLGVAAPTDLVRDTRISPFNIGQRIELRDFTPDEAQPLARGLRQASEDDSEPQRTRLLRRVLHWTGGHPYMTQRLCQATALAPVQTGPWWKGAEVEQVDTVCRDLFLTAAAQETDDNLTFARNRLSRSGTDTATLLDIYLRIRRGEPVRDDNTDPFCSLLRLSGVVRHDQGLLRVRNRIYAAVFDPAWVQASLPGEEVRRQRRAYQLGIWRAATAGGIGVLVFASLAAVALDRSAAAHRASREARTQEALARTRLSRIYVDAGVRLMDAGDYGGALAPLAEAMMLDKEDPARLALHRRRFAAVLAVTPHLDHLWSSDKPLRWACYCPSRRFIATAGEDGWVHVREAATGAELPLSMHHDGPVLYVAFSPDGALLVTCGADARACIWDLKARRLLHTLRLQTRKGQNPEVTHAAWSRDGRQLSLSCGDTVYLWEMRGNPVTPRLVLQSIDARAIHRQTAFAPDGRHLASIAENYLAWYMALPSGKEEFSIGPPALGKNYAGQKVSFSRDGRRLLVAGSFGGAGQNTGVAVLATEAGHDKPLIPLLRHEQLATDAAFSPDERQIATASTDGTARVWDAATGQPITPPLRHQGPVLHVAFSPEGRRVVTACADGEARVWDAATGEAVCAPLHHAGAVVAAQFGRDGDHVFTASRDGTARLWTLPRPENISQRINRASPTTVTFSFSQDGNRLVTRITNALTAPQENAFIRVYDLKEERFPRAVLFDANGFSSSFGSDDDGVLLVHGTGQLNVGDLDNPPQYSPLQKVQTWDERRGKPISPVLRADWATMNHAGTRVLLGDRHGRLQLVDAATGKAVLPPLHQTLGKEFYKHFQPFTPDDRGFLRCDSARSIRLFDARSGRPLTPPMMHDSTVSQWLFSPSGRYLFTWSDSRAARAWNVADGTPASDPVPASEPFQGGSRLQFTPDGRYAITFTSVGCCFWPLDGSTRLHPRRLNLRCRSVVISPDSKTFVALEQANWLWNTDTLTPINPSFNDGAEIVAAVFSPDSRRVLTVRDDGTALLWDVRAARPITPPLLQRKLIHCGMSEDGRMIATGGKDGISRVWDASTGEPITPALPMRGQVNQVRFTPDGKWLITAGFEEGRLWKLPETSVSPEQLQSQAQLLSGQRIDPTIGSVPVDPATIRAAWERAGR